MAREMATGGKQVGAAPSVVIADLEEWLLHGVESD